MTTRVSFNLSYKLGKSDKMRPFRSFITPFRNKFNNLVTQKHDCYILFII